MMNNDPQIFNEIDVYLSGELSVENRDAFEKKLKDDASLQEELNTTIDVIEGIQGYAFKNMLKDLHKKLFDNREDV